MFTTFIILSVIFSVLLVLIVLIQNSKGGGISANFSAANQIAGVKKTNDFIEKATWTLAIGLFVLALGSRFVYSTDVEQTNQFLDRIENSGVDFTGSSQTAPPQITNGESANKAIKAVEETSEDGEM